MDSKVLRRRSGLIVVEIMAVAVVLVVIAASMLGLRLLSSPLDVEFARPYIQEALRDGESGTYVSMDKIMLFWPDLREPILLGLQGAKVYGPDDKLIASIDEAALGLNKLQLLLGRVRPEALILKRPSLSIIRNKDDSFDIGVADTKNYGPTQIDGESEGDFVERILSALAGVEEGPLGVLKSFEIEEASLLIDDRVLGFAWELPDAAAVVERREGGLAGSVRVDLPGKGDKPAELSVNALVQPHNRSAAVEALLTGFDLAVLREKMPEVQLLTEMDMPVNAVLKAGITQGSDGGATILDVSSAQLALGETVIEANAELALNDREIIGPVRIEIEQLEHAVLPKIWPVALAEDNSKEWIVDKLGDGTFSDLYAQGDLVLAQTDEGWNGDVRQLLAGFAFEGMSINYRPPLKAVTEAKGKGVFDLNSETLRIDIESAKLLDLDITKADVELINIIEAGKGQADINIELNGPVKDVLTYIQDEPIAAETEIDIANSTGQADMEVNISLPTKNNIRVEDVSVNVMGTLSDANVPNVVKGLTLTGGPYDVKIHDNLLHIKGSGALAGQPATLDYKEHLISEGAHYSSKVEASLMVDDAMREAFGIDLTAFLEGSGYVDVTYTKFTDGRAEANVAANLEQALLFVDPFDYEKPAGQTAGVTLKAFLKNDVLQEIRDLKGTAPSFTLEPSTLGFRQQGGETLLSSATIPRFTIDETVARLEFERTSAGLAKIALEGPFLDLRPFLNKDEDEEEVYNNPPMQISVAVDRMRTAEEETVQYGKLYADIDGEGKFNQLEMDAIAGQGDIYLRYKPDASGKRVFRMEADDAGATLRAFDVYDNVRGGKLVIYGEPIRGVFDRNLLGSAKMSDFKVVKAPALAKLLSAMSLPGLQQNLGGEGLSFTKMEANFDWLYRPGGSLLVLKDGRTSGNSLGLTFDGTFDNQARTVDVAGTIIPLSGVNKIIGDIPIVGDILTGGTGALIAATYKVEGPADDVKTSVNPLSVLTPGILRRILFEQGN